MTKLNTDSKLKDIPTQFEDQQSDEDKMVKTQLNVIIDTLKPVNVLKGTLKEITISGGQGSMVNTAIGVTTGYLVKKIFEAISRRPFRRIIGSVLMVVVTNIVARNPERVKALAAKALRAIKSRSHQKAIENENR